MKFIVNMCYFKNIVLFECQPLENSCIRPCYIVWQVYDDDDISLLITKFG